MRDMTKEADYPLSKLIADLEAVLADKGDGPVEIEGCDCTGRAKAVSFDEGVYPSGSPYRYVLIERHQQ